MIPDRATLLDVIARDCAAPQRRRRFAGYRLKEKKSGGYPTLDELDAASGGRPLFILRTDGHLRLANSAAFAACGIGADAADPLSAPFARRGRFLGQRVHVGAGRCLHRQSRTGSHAPHVAASNADRR
jgi:predicted amidohydrolase YtcJ